MDLNGQFILSYLEEDNTQRAFFRVKPLMTSSGPCKPDDEGEFPDHGFLRIVPDKNEQYSFKERMRSIGGFCLINLHDFPPNSNKIRPNKNYSQEMGELNRFIIYSDTIQPLPEALFFEVLENAESGSALLSQQYYLSTPEGFQGPFKAEEKPAEDAPKADLSPQALFRLTTPDGKEHLLYWPPAPLAEADPEPSLSAQDRITMMSNQLPPLQNPMKAESPAPAFVAPPSHGKLSGTPLFSGGAKSGSHQNNYNKLTALVASQVHQQRPEDPGAKLEDPSALRTVESPAEAFKHALKAMWSGAESRKQATNYLLSMPGAQDLLSELLAGSSLGVIPMAMKNQLDNLEAERLSLLMQTDKAKANFAGLKKDALESATNQEKAELLHLEQLSARATEALEALKTQINALSEERKRLSADLNPANWKLYPQVGDSCTPQEAAHRLLNQLKALGFDCVKDDAMNLLLLYALSSSIQICAPSGADAISAGEGFAMALGAAYCISGPGSPEPQVFKGGTAPAFVISETPRSQVKSYHCVIPSAQKSPPKPLVSAYLNHPWPVVVLPTADLWPSQANKPYPPIDELQLKAALLKEQAALSPGIQTLLEQISALLSQHKVVLPLFLRRQISLHLSCGSILFDGGIAAALDYSFSSWLLPYVLNQGLQSAVLAPLIQGMPRCSGLL